MTLERRRILYSGSVQGVGFRWATVTALKDAPVTGYVRNMPDGKVELVIEGAPLDNDDAARKVRAALARYIRQETEERGPATGEFRAFGILR
ncbi:MAG: acylphosphatase [Planctomycetota bacterium]